MTQTIFDSETTLESQIRHKRHPVKDDPLTITGNEDCDIPELTANFLFGGAQIEQPEILNCN
jgi:hypothetical protein